MTESKYVRPEIKVDRYRLSLIFYQAYTYWVIILVLTFLFIGSLSKCNLYKIYLSINILTKKLL
jgi:hypothetical protein